MKEIVIVGTGDYSEVLSFIIEKKLKRRIASYSVNREYLVTDTYNNKPVVAFENLEKEYPPSRYELVLAFGSRNMMNYKSKIFKQAKEKGYHLPNIIHPDASVDATDMGEGNIIFSLVVIEAHCKIGDCNVFWPGCILPHHNEIGNFNSFSPGVTFSGYACVKNHSFVGSNVSIKNKVIIGDYVYVGAGAYVPYDLMDHQVFVPTRGKILEGKTGFDFL